MCPMLIPKAFGGESCAVAGDVNASARRRTDANVVFIADTLLGIISERKFSDDGRTNPIAPAKPDDLQFHGTTRWLMLFSTPEVKHMRHATIIGLLIGCVLVTATLSAQVGRLPDQITDQE